MILVALGANLGSAWGLSARATCERACGLLGGIGGLRLVAVSRWYGSAPVPASAQPRYVNGVAALSGQIAPAALLGELAAIEAAAGRVRGAENAARPLDLDIIDMDGLVRDAPDPILPHPRAHLRGFVLLPLRGVAPGWVHPRSGQGIDALIAALPPQDVAVLPD